MAPIGFVDDCFIHYLKRAETFLRVTLSPSNFVVRKIISGIKARKNSKTPFLFFVVRYFLYDFKREVKLTVSQKKEKKFLFFKNKKTGFDIKKTFSLKGYFLKVGDLK